MLGISLQLQIIYTHTLSVTKSSPNTTLIVLNHIPIQLCPSLYTTQSHPSPQHKLFCAFWNSWATAKFPMSSRFSPHYCSLFILSETYPSYSCEYSLPIPNVPPSFSLNILASLEAQREVQKLSTSPCVNL